MSDNRPRMCRLTDEALFLFVENFFRGCKSEMCMFFLLCDFKGFFWGGVKNLSVRCLGIEINRSRKYLIIRKSMNEDLFEFP